MTTVLIVGWIGVIIASYKLCLYALTKTDNL